MQQIIQGALALGLLWSIMTIGVYCTYRILDIADLTAEGSITLGAATAAAAIVAGTNPFAASALAFCAGALAGLSTALLHTKLRIPPLLAGILTMIALYSVNLRVMGKANLPLLRVQSVYTGLENIGLTKNMATIVFGGGAALLVIVILYWFFGTEIGCAIRATGINARMSRAQGINTDAMKTIGLMLGNALIALSGALIAQYQSFADIQMGTGSIVIGLASVIIGEVLFGKKGFFSRFVSLVFGAVTYRLIIAGVLKMGMNANDLKLFTAITVAIALSLPVFSEYINTCKKSLRTEELPCSKS